jgi:type VI protein secretion system component VasF
LKSSVNVDGEKPMAVRVAVIEVEVVELKRQRTEARERQWQVRLALWTSIAFPIVVGVTLYLLLRTS